MTIDHYEHHHREEHSDSALNVSQGVGGQPVVNPGFVRKRRPELTTEQFVEGILARDIAILSQAITLVESNNPAHYRQAQQIIERCLPHAGRSIRIGITGVPGAGKSTFIEAVGGMVVSRRGVLGGAMVAGEGLARAAQHIEGHRLAVLAIDPSSERSGGSILGDKTRMESISTDPRIFIRPSPSAGSLGGVARKTRETVVLCEAAGYDVIFIETVGVGQSETAVHSMVDMFRLLQIAGAGDELQGIKRGIMEMADMIVITKADGDNTHRAELAKRQFENALMLFPTPESGWRPQVYTSSAVAGTGLKEVWAGVGEYMKFTASNGFHAANRNRQNQYWMRETIDDALRSNFYNDPEIESLLPHYREMVSTDRMSSFVAAHELLDRYYKR
jgi:LAO/AO transport system kinase